jgi:hypothetical protein
VVPLVWGDAVCGSVEKDRFCLCYRKRFVCTIRGWQQLGAQAYIDGEFEKEGGTHVCK